MSIAARHCTLVQCWLYVDLLPHVTDDQGGAWYKVIAFISAFPPCVEYPSMRGLTPTHAPTAVLLGHARGARPKGVAELHTRAKVFSVKAPYCFASVPGFARAYAGCHDTQNVEPIS